MSLILDALRRAERHDPRHGSEAVLVGRHTGPRFGPLLAALAIGIAVGGWFFSRTTSRGAATTVQTPRESAPEQDRQTPWDNTRRVIEVPAAQERDTGTTVPIAKPTPRTTATSSLAVLPSATPHETMPARPTPHVKISDPSARVLQGISTRDGVPIAMINGRLYREGELVNGARVLKIRSETVEILEANGTGTTLSFPELQSDPDPSPTVEPRPLPRERS